MKNKHRTSEENAGRLAEWIKERGGIAIWPSVNLSNPGASWTTPALTDGKPTCKPTWQAADSPVVITDPEQVEVVKHQEVKRFHVGLRRGDNGFAVKLTDAASLRVRREVEKAGDDACYKFDYDTQEAVILRPASVVTLVEWIGES